MSGIPLAPWSIDADGCVAMLVRAQSDSATHIARPVPEDEAREAVIAAARAFCAGVDEGRIDMVVLRETVERIDALTKGDG